LSGIRSNDPQKIVIASRSRSNPQAKSIARLRRSARSGGFFIEDGSAAGPVGNSQ
jgi:hypothetical protein